MISGRNYRDKDDIDALTSRIMGVKSEHKKSVTKPKRSREYITLKIPKFQFKMVGIGVLISVLGFLVFTNLSSSENNPAVEVSAASNMLKSVSDFQPYYFENESPPNGLHLQDDSISFEEGVLIFSLINEDGNKVSITQQEVPEIFSSSVPKGSEQVSTSYGEAAIGLMEDRVVGSLIAESNGQKTFIILSGGNDVSVDLMRTVIRNLRPFENQ